MNNAEIINLVEKHSVLAAVKYVKDHNKNWILADCKEYVENVMGNRQKQIGSITWFNCDYLPPISEITEFGTYSVEVLVSNNINVAKSKYVRLPDGKNVGWFGVNVFGFEPTHWAYINLPKPS